MAVVYANSLKDTRMTAVITALDSGASSGSPATMEIGNAGFANVLVVINLAFPSFTEATQAINMASTPRSGTAGTTGTAALARLKDHVGTIIVSGLSVGTSGSDVNLSSLSITATQVVQINSGSITHG